MSVFLTVIVPLTTAAILLSLWTHPKIRRIIALLGSGLHVLSAFNLMNEVKLGAIVIKNLGDWPAPFGITFQADTLSGTLVLVAACVGFLVNIYSSENLDSPVRDFGFHPLLFVLLAGVSGAFVTGDLFNLFVWFECILLSSFVLLALGGEKDQIRGAMNYVVPNLFSSMLFLSGLGLLYGVTGTLNMEDIALQIPNVPPGLIAAISVLFLVAFGIKSALFPFVSWLPTSYHTPPIAITALFAGLLTKVGVYALIRFFTKVIPLQPGPIQDILIIGTILTMVLGILPALVANDIKKVLAYNIISHIGTMVAGLSIATAKSLEGTTFYMIHHILTMAGLFFVVGIIERNHGSTLIPRVKGALKKCPTAGVLFVILGLALSGIPPLSGFWPKLILLKAALENQDQNPMMLGLVAAMIIASALTLFSIARIWNECFINPDKEEMNNQVSRPWPKYFPATLIAAAVILFGLLPSILESVSLRAGDQLAAPLQIPSPEELP